MKWKNALYMSWTTPYDGSSHSYLYSHGCWCQCVHLCVMLLCFINLALSHCAHTHRAGHAPLWISVFVWFHVQYAVWESEHHFIFPCPAVYGPIFMYPCLATDHEILCCLSKHEHELCEIKRIAMFLCSVLHLLSLVLHMPFWTSHRSTMGRMVYF